jgi:hypothetical protein
MQFDGSVVLDAVTRFCETRGLTPTKLSVVARLSRALTIASHHGTDPRWRTAPYWAADDDPRQTLFGHLLPQDLDGQPRDDPTRTTGDRVLAAELRRRREPTARWTEHNAVVAADRWARFSRSMSAARCAGLGWLVPVRGELLAVPLPAIRTAEGQPDVLHDDTGRPAVEWLDGTGTYFLHGAEFDERLYRKVIASELLIQDIAQLPNADQRSVALTYLSFERLVVDSDAELLDVGVRGTKLYRLPLPFRIRRDRVVGYGLYDYFIHMRDASHPEREFVEWVDPTIGAQRNAELCQAHAFGITLSQWLAIDQEG